MASKVLCLGDIPIIAANLKSMTTNTIKLLHLLIFGEDAGRKNRSNLRKFQGFTFQVNSGEYNKKFDFIKENFSERNLIAICTILGIENEETSDDVIDKLISQLSNLNNFVQEEMEDESDESDDEDDDDEKEEEKDDESESKASSVTEHSLNDELPVSERHDEITSRKKKSMARYGVNDKLSNKFEKCVISFKDVEDTIRTFDGRSNYAIEKWLSDFEELAEMLEWNELQKFIFGKKSLRGIAKLHIMSEKNINSWQKLKAALVEEFAQKVSMVDLHKTLAKRKMKKDEDVYEYFLVMKELASRGVMDEKSLLQYVIEGIQDSTINKMMLYGASNLKDFKEKLKQYAAYRSECSDNRMNKVKVEYSKQNNRKIGHKDSIGLLCYNCGEKGHPSRFCTQKEKGKKCFRCNQFGHIAIDCSSNEGVRSKSNVHCVDVTNNDSTSKVVKINKKRVNALIDTGSKFNIMRKDTYDILGRPDLCSTNISLVGFGQRKEENQIKPMGILNTNIEIDNHLFNLNFYVVHSNCMDVELIIGKELYKQAEMTINPNGIFIKKIETDSEKEVISIMNISTMEEDINIDESASKDAKEKIKKMIHEYEPKKIKTTNVEMKILLTDETPIYHQPRRLPLKEKEFVEKQVEEWVKDGIVEPCYSDYSSQVIVVKKRDGSSRLCIDFRKINKVTVKDRYPLPLIEDQLDRLQESKIFSTIDLKNGFFHVSVNEESRKYTSFVTCNGQYQFKKVPFGLSNSPAVFQRHINCIFRDLNNKGVALIYMDDIIIPAKDENEAVDRLEEVLKVSAEYGLEINLKKCHLLKRKVEFLGHTIENGNLYPSSEKTKAVLQFPQPQNLKQIQSFLGLTGYFRKFIPNYAQIAKPLSDMLKKDAKFKFMDAEETSFNTLKKVLCNKPVLGIYNQNYETELHTDASVDGYGAVLLQRCPDDLKLHPIYFMSRKTTEQEKKYTSYELEILAVIEALKKFRIYLLGIKFKLLTDCSAFQKTLQKKDLTTRVARWILLLEEYDFTIEHRPGIRMKHVDSLSRNPVYTITENSLVSRIRKAQESDEDLQPIIEILKERSYEDYYMKDKLLYKFEAGQEVLVIPKVLQMEIIKQAHDRGHFGAKKTKELIRKEYYIPKLDLKIERYISNCISCIVSNRKRGKQEGELHPLFKEDSPLHTYHVDFLGPLDSTNKNYNHIFAVVDSFTKFVWLYPTRSTSSKDALSKLEMQSKIFGNPAILISDRGAAFTSNEFKTYCEDECIKHLTITTGLPRANGQVERVNSVIISVLTKLSINDSTKWFKHVDKVQQAINSTYHRSIDSTPFELLTGVKMKTKEDIILQDMIKEEMISNFKDARDDLRKDAKKNIIKMQDQNRRYYNMRRRTATKYKKGDLVAIKRTQLGGGLKLKPKFMGPYQVIKVKGNDTYDLQKEGHQEGPSRTSSCAEFMKPWPLGNNDDLLAAFEANDPQDGRIVE